MAVIFIHVSGEAVTTLTRPSLPLFAMYVPWKLASFAVPGFIFAAGMKQMLSSTRHGYFSYLGKRLLHVVLPYVIWNVVYYAYYVLNDYYEFSLGQLLRSILVGDMSAQFYFVVIIVQFYLLRPLWTLIVDRYHPLPVLGIAFIVTLICGNYIPFWFSDRLFVAYPIYWLCGCYAAKYYDSFTATLKKRKIEVIAVFAFFASCLVLFTYLTFIQKVFFGFLGILQIAYSISAICAVYLVCLYIPELKAIKLIDSASYGIYLMHCLVLIVTDNLLDKFGVVSIKLDFIIKTAAVYVISLTVCTIYVYIKNKLIKKHLQ